MKLSDEIKEELEFCKRNPEIPLVFVVFPTAMFVIFVVLPKLT